MQHVTDVLDIVQTAIRESFDEARSKPKDKDKSFNFIKVVHAHEVNAATDIRGVLRSSESLKILDVDVDDIPFICDKQVAPLSGSLCNFTKCARDLPCTSPPPEPVIGKCACRSFFPQSIDLVNNHIMTADISILGDKGARDLFNYGAKYRINLKEVDIMTSIKEGLAEYLFKQERSMSTSSDVTIDKDRRMQHLKEWQAYVLGKYEKIFKIIAHPINRRLLPVLLGVISSA